jgi:choline dehydrogenase-like flavoprotein
MTSNPVLATAMSAAERAISEGTLICDAIVVGAGATGSLAAQLLSEGGLKTLMLDAGVPRSQFHSSVCRFARRVSRKLLGASTVDAFIRRRQPIQSHCYAWAGTPEAFIDDLDCPYVTPDGYPFVWLRSRQLGGRMAVPGHGHQYYRLGLDDFFPTDGMSPGWPLRAGEMDRWYDAVERRLGLSGSHDNLPWLPDGILERVAQPTATESAAQRLIKEKWPNARPILSRQAPFQGFAEGAARTGRLLLRMGAIARKIDVDAIGRVQAVSWIDRQSRREQRCYAPLVFLCASALESTRLLMLSRSESHPDGIGGSSGILGHFLMDHIRVRIAGRGPPMDRDVAVETGRCLYLPRFDSRHVPQPTSARGFGVQLYVTPAGRGQESHFSAGAFGEMLPRSENHVALHPTVRDAWGIPVLSIDCRHDSNELDKAHEQISALRELAVALGARITTSDDGPAPPGSANHECGTARMGDSPSNSVVDPNNECWEARGLYLTDGAALPSQGTQNPTLTLLALTARACHHALSATN